MQITVSSIKAACEQLKVSRAEFYRRVSAGTLVVERFEREGKRVYTIRNSPLQSSILDTPTVEGGDFAVSDYLFNKPGQAQLIKEWLAWYSDGVDVNAWAESHRRDQLNYIIRYFQRYDDISAENLRAWLAQVDKGRVTLRRHMHGAVSSFARFLNERKEILSDEERAAIRRLYPRVPRGFKRERKIIYREQLPDILAGASKAAGKDRYREVLFKTLVVLFSTTALRLSEVCSLKLSSLRFNEDLRKATITVVGKGGKERTIPFPKLAQQYVLEYLAIRPHRTEQADKEKDTLFWVHSPRYGYTTLKKYALVHYMREISEASGIAFTAHSFRHYRITMWMDDGQINPSHAQLWAGHSDLKTTQGYTHIRDVDALASAYRAGYDELGLSQTMDLKPQRKHDPLAALVQEITQLSPQEKAQLLAKMVGA